MSEHVSVSPLASKPILVFGLGHIGAYIHQELKSRRYRVIGYDLRDGHDLTNLETVRLALVKGCAVIDTLPYQYNLAIAQEAASLGVPYFNLSEDVRNTNLIREMSSSSVLIPQCGLAPGMVSILAAHLTADYEHIDSLTIRVGALPAIVSNHLGYALTWSCAGLINEYCAPCDVIENGVRTHARALDDVESVTVGDLVLEAAHTSGGVGTLANSYLGKAHILNYKTLRYPGHFQYMRMFRDDLKLAEHKSLAEQWFSAALPRTASDLVAIQITADGTRVGVDNHRYPVSQRYSHIVHATASVTAIQQTTAHGCLAVVDAYLRGHIPQRGFVRQEELPFDAIAQSPFFDVYRGGFAQETI